MLLLPSAAQAFSAYVRTLFPALFPRRALLAICGIHGGCAAPILVAPAAALVGIFPQALSKRLARRANNTAHREPLLPRSAVDKMLKRPNNHITGVVEKMRITVDIDEKSMRRIQQATGLSKKAAAVRHAAEGYVKELEKKRFIQKVLGGGTDYAITNEELESLGIYDTD